MQKNWIRRLLFFLPVIIALIFFIVLPRLNQPPQKAEAIEPAVTVRVIEVPRIPVVIKAVGYGTTESARSWEAVAEVSGQVARISDELKNGEIVAQGTELLHIDDSNYRLALTQVETQLNTLEVKDRITRASLALEERSQSILAKDIERKRELRKQGTISPSVLEEAERNLLKGEAAVQNLKNTLELNAAEKKVLQTQKAAAELDLSRTRISAPFDVRITGLSVSQAQYVNKGQILFSADGIDATEVEARFPIGRLRPLIAGKTGESGAMENTPALRKAPGALTLEATVRLKTATHTIEWEARVDRASGTIDPQTQTLGVVVVVDKPYEQAQPGQRPALARNTFVEVELRKNPEGKSLIIPSSALHDGKVYVVNNLKRLEIRTVKTAFRQEGYTAIAGGLEENETLVVSDLIPAVQGMLLDPVKDEKTLKNLMANSFSSKGKQR
ncbi:MAG: efflux RND transporter periplasmic adaptor subunit [Dehalococcoidales bacterium]|nr:efflux RND transporter periplasmic adaptor subunit [Dehalococcoidales bacterium]